MHITVPSIQAARFFYIGIFSFRVRMTYTTVEKGQDPPLLK